MKANVQIRRPAAVGRGPNVFAGPQTGEFVVPHQSTRDGSALASDEVKRKVIEIVEHSVEGQRISLGFKEDSKGDQSFAFRLRCRSCSKCWQCYNKKTQQLRIFHSLSLWPTCTTKLAWWASA